MNLKEMKEKMFNLCKEASKAELEAVDLEISEWKSSVESINGIYEEFGRLHSEYRNQTGLIWDKSL